MQSFVNQVNKSMQHGNIWFCHKFHESTICRKQSDIKQLISLDPQVKNKVSKYWKEMTGKKITTESSCYCFGIFGFFVCLGMLSVKVEIALGEQIIKKFQHFKIRTTLE